MVSVEWCVKQKSGLELVEPNENVAKSYLGMAEESIGELNIVVSKLWQASITYYTFYYSLYALMQRIGVKCEIHSCSLLFMEKFLSEFFSKEDVRLVKRAFQMRINLQYYANRPVDVDELEQLKKEVRDFYLKSKDVMSRLKEDDIEKVREGLKKLL